MNTFSLTLKSRELEEEYQTQQIIICKRKLYVLLLSYFCIGIVDLVNIFLDFISIDSSSQEQAKGSMFVIVTSLIIWMISVAVNITILSLCPSKINIYHFGQHILNIIYHLALIKFEFIEDFSESNITYNATPQTVNSTHHEEFHSTQGILLSLIIFTGLLFQTFLTQMVTSLIAVTSLIILYYHQMERPFVEIIIAILCLIIGLTWMYEDSKQSRMDFLVRRKNDEWNKIIKQVLPTNLIIAKYNKKEERVELKFANRKAIEELGIVDSDSFQKFAHNTEVEINEIISNERDLNRILRISGAIHTPNTKIEVVNKRSLYQVIRCKIQAEITKNIKGSKEETTIEEPDEESRENIRKNQKNEQINISNKEKSALHRLESDLITNQIWGKAKKLINSYKIIHQNSKKSSINNANKNKQKNLNISEFIGSYYPNGFDLEKKLLIRVSTYSLSEIFAVITIENETYREKYIKQIKISTFLEKIFSFQLRKFKQSYSIVLNELRQVKDTDLQKKLVYHNVKCMNRVNSYLQYFEFKNAKKCQFSVTKFSLTGEVYNILSSLRHYISGKHIRTFYENPTKRILISTDEEKLQQILFMILEHLMVNSPKNGYIGIRIKDDPTIKDCFKVQIQSSYDSQLITQINLQSFSIDELYNDYELYQNYFVSLRIAVKLITLLGPYDKINFEKMDSQTLFISFSIFSDLEVIKNQLRPSHNSQPTPQSRVSKEMSSNKMVNKINMYKTIQSTREIPLKTNNQTSPLISPQNLPSPLSQEYLQEIDESANVTQEYDEQHSFHNWILFKQFHFTTQLTDRVMKIIPQPFSGSLYQYPPQDNIVVSDKVPLKKKQSDVKFQRSISSELMNSSAFIHNSCRKPDHKDAEFKCSSHIFSPCSRHVLEDVNDGDLPQPSFSPPSKQVTYQTMGFNSHRVHSSDSLNTKSPRIEPHCSEKKTPSHFAIFSGCQSPSWDSPHNLEQRLTFNSIFTANQISHRPQKQISTKSKKTSIIRNLSLKSDKQLQSL